jgi:hypothetical protein
MRAVERFEKALPTAVRLTEPDGRVGLMIGTAQAGQAKALIGDVEWNEPVDVPGGHSRILLVGTKVGKVGQQTCT